MVVFNINFTHHTHVLILDTFLKMCYVLQKQIFEKLKSLNSTKRLDGTFNGLTKNWLKALNLHSLLSVDGYVGVASKMVFTVCSYELPRS